MVGFIRFVKMTYEASTNYSQSLQQQRQQHLHKRERQAWAFQSDVGCPWLDNKKKPTGNYWYW
jgi:hypothetical protein